MPTYEYACTSCGTHTDVVQSFMDAPLTTCSICGGDLRKVYSPVGIAFKGTGFYRNDSRASAGASKAGVKAAEGGSDSGSGAGPGPGAGAGDSTSKESRSGSSEAGSSGSSGSSGSEKGGSPKATDSNGKGSGAVPSNSASRRSESA